MPRHPGKPTLFFDVMSTLVHDPFYVEMPAFFGIAFEELLASKHPDAWLQFESGLLDEASFLLSFFKDRRAYDHAAFKAHIFGAYRWVDGMQELMGELKSASLDMHILSNYPPWYEEIERRLGLARFVPWSFVSCEMGVRKPNPEAFLLPLKRLGLEARTCVFVDDQRVNCEAAKELGMDAVLFHDARRLREDLVVRGFLSA